MSVKTLSSDDFAASKALQQTPPADLRWQDRQHLHTHRVV